MQLYNTKKRKKEEFKPIDPEHIRMYVCGPTVYNYVHIGNARPPVVFDTLYRVLKSAYPKVSYARNITDIDDKIMQAAKDNGETIQDVSERYTLAFAEDMAAINCLVPDIIPKATEHLPEMIEMIEKLIAKGHAYESEKHVLFDVRSMENYGELSNRKLEDMLDGARVEVADYKKYAGDFVLWKPSVGDEPGWESPWGFGRPGWHLECSAMIKKHLGESIDIHGGGKDLIFPHHENEVAQSCCANDAEEYVRYWMHNGYINIDGEKMSKSLGNFRLVRDLLKAYPGEVLRYAILSAHYRSDMDFSQKLLSESKDNLDYIYGVLRDEADTSSAECELQSLPVFAALLDDLNTREAITQLLAVAKRLKLAEAQDKPALKGELMAIAGVLGLLEQDPEQWFTQGGADDLAADVIEALIEERLQARADKNFARADEIRDQLKEQGVLLDDYRADGGGIATKWRREG
ncbi:cysteine--tRNA ligase [uncultured Pseudoteredinibacter sp.]|uniref:cysteine--tRNA ligase n=1 Tax=uncultured Pseudoteredinibacter sp. TaxID=1641701 RepID=UPI002608EFCB|nr:cysteine--tRNA ligase [uncultured Pseudoteredinibacter sp.]